MGKAAMMREAKNPSLKLAEHIQIRRFSGQRNRRGGESRLAIQSGSPHAGAGQEVGNGFQSLMKLCSWSELERIHYPVVGRLMGAMRRHLSIICFGDSWGS
jgi:hypothetical protein